MFDGFVPLEEFLRLVVRRSKELFYLRLLCFERGYLFFGLGNLFLFLAAFGSRGFLCGVVEFGRGRLNVGLTSALTVVRPSFDRRD